MRPINTFLILATALSLWSCSKSGSHSTTAWCLVTAGGPNMDCGIWQVHVDSGLDQVIAVLQQGSDLLPGLATQGTFIAAGLADSLKTPGAKLLLEIRKPASGELLLCTDMGPGFPWLYVIRGKKALSSGD